MTSRNKPSAAVGRRDGPLSKESVSVEVERALHGSSHTGLRTVRCHFEDGVVTLNGQVATYYLKQVAQTIVARQPAVRQVRNELRVSRSDPVRLEP